MYWPIGAPRIYAASSSKAVQNRTLESDDDAESRGTEEGGGSLLEAQIGALKLEDGQDASYGGSPTPMTPKTPGIRPVEHDSEGRYFPQFSSQLSTFIGSADKEPLLSLKISRIGHLFAVITSTTLTIWQTKARTSQSTAHNV